MRAHLPPPSERGLYLAAWSMMAAVALFVAVSASLVPVLVWAMSPPDRGTASVHLYLDVVSLGAPLSLLAVAGTLAVTASVVVFAVAAAFLRAPQDELHTRVAERS